MFGLLKSDELSWFVKFLCLIIWAWNFVHWFLTHWSLSWIWFESFLTCHFCFRVALSWCIILCFLWACLCLHWLSEFDWHAYTCPNAMMFGVLIIWCVLFRLDFSWDLLNHFGINMLVIILFASLSFQLAYIDMICLWNEIGWCFWHETTWILFLID
jgi:hypothetical protein